MFNKSPYSKNQKRKKVVTRDRVSCGYTPPPLVMNQNAEFGPKSPNPTKKRTALKGLQLSTTPLVRKSKTRNK